MALPGRPGPGVALLTALAWPASADHHAVRRVARAAVAVVVVSCLATQVWTAFRPPRDAPWVVDAVAYLRTHGSPVETGVVAFGQPQILRGAGLEPAYEYLWSLPARVRDPDVRALGRVLTGPDRPDRLVVSGRSLATWGIDDRAASALGREVGRDYEVVHRNDHLTVLRLTRRGAARRFDSPAVGTSGIMVVPHPSNQERHPPRWSTTVRGPLGPCC